MREYLKTITRRGADALGGRYLTGSGAKKLRRILPRPSMYSLIPAWDNVLVLAPHPDDEVFGAGLLLNKLREQNKKLTIAFATNGGAYSTGAVGERKREAEASAHRLGAETVFMNLRDGQLKNTPGLEDKIAALCNRIQPQGIILPWVGDYHPDHRALARAAIRRPQKQAHYLFYSTFSPLWPSKEFKLSFTMGGEEKVLAALEGYNASVNRETVNGFIVLRRALARAYLNNNTFWEPFLTIPGEELASAMGTIANWPEVYPTLKKARHWRSFLTELGELQRAIGKTK